MGRAEDVYEKIKKEGLKAIDEFILDRESEELFLDFKRSTDNGSGKKLDQKDRNNLAVAISGFGNSEGGVIVWGIDCSKDDKGADVACAKYPIKDIKKFKSWIENAISGCTVPPIIGVQNHTVNISDKGDGFVVTYIPNSVHTPHQVMGKNQYYIRAGSSFVPTPHSVLAGMFGKKPQPNVFQMYASPPAELINDKIKIELGFLIVNKGPGIANDLYLNLKVISKPGNNCEVSFELIDQNNWIGQLVFGVQFGIISKKDVRLPPDSLLNPFVMHLIIAPPFTNSLLIEGTCGSGNSPSRVFKLENDNKSIRKLYDDFLEDGVMGCLDNMARHDIVNKLLNIQL